MLILESLWQPSGKDVLGRVNPIAVRREGSANVVATTVNLDFDELVDRDQVFLLQHYEARFQPGGVATAVQQQLLVRDVLANRLVQTIHLTQETAAFSLRPQGGSPYTLIFGGEGLRFNGTFTADVNPHFITASFFGIIMPRGNWQRD